MRLKSLQIKGFKSFADNTVLNFDENVIGVVGPNGSGKSNIVDAIRWVLGEQKSRELRLEKMGDVIFNGTKSRKKGGVAQVTLTFENTKNLIPTEYPEVSVSRLLYQSGDSEYRLNNVTCRLKDITTLLMDTGIGSNSYAIIALGMVDDILNDKENARRKMFEQAAGISKYKKRKRETLLKLKSTADDLERVDDLLFELQKNMSSLERQAKRTERFYTLKNEYKDKSVQAAFMNIESFQTQKVEMDNTIANKTISLEKTSAEVNTKEAELQKIKKDNLSQEQNLSGFQEEVNQLINEVRNLEYDKKSNIEKIAYNKSRRDELIKGIEDAQSNIEKLSAECVEIESDLSGSRSTVSQMQEAYKQSEGNYESSRAEYEKVKDEFDEASKERQEGERILNEAEKDKAVLESRLSILSQDLGFLDESFSAVSSNKGDLEARLQSAEAAVTEKQTKLENILVSKAGTEQKKQELTSRKTELEKALIKINRSLDAKKHQRDLLQNMIDNLEGYPESIKFLNNNWRSTTPILADILNVKEEVRGIVEQYLEPYLNYFIVDNIKDATEAINLLANSQKGKANFFLLDEIKTRLGGEAKVANATHVTEFMQVDSQYEKLVDFLLHNVYIYNGELTELAGINGAEQYVFLSSDGRYIKNKFAIGGGSKGLFEGSKIGRQKNLEDLVEQIQQEEKQRKELERKEEGILGQISELDQLDHENEIESLKSDLEIVNHTRIEISTKLKSIYEQVEEQNKKRTSIASNQTQILATIASKSDIINQVADKLTKVSVGSISSDTGLSSYTERLSVHSAELNEVRINLIREENKLESLEKDFSYRKNRIEELTEILTRNNTTSTQLLEEIKELTSVNETLETNLVDKYKVQQGKQSQLSEVEQKYFKERSGIHVREDEIRELNRKVSSTQALINELKEKQNTVKLELVAVDERLKAEFQISLDAINKNELDLTVDLEELNEAVNKLKHKLNNYGEINPLALEAYDEIKIRFDEMNTQRQDILTAKESLLETIQEIEDTASLKFMEAFDKVRANFKEVFRSLFSDEDDCDLVLLSDSTPMEAQIEIIAKPKGKRPKTISQLSGGEKTLTATALLFALYLLKPAPFCIFDEVDAPLDDANVQKFNNIITTFSKDSQFIVVTHNKLTMAEMDVIYGVYMQEQGVSGVSAVDFRNYEHQAYFETVA